MHLNRNILAISLLWLAGCASLTPSPTFDEHRAQVVATETAFAKTMADRDHAAFSAFIADEAIFLGGATPLRGKAQVVAAWKHYFDKPEAPFSWLPDTVEVLDSGRLALSSGPVKDGKGKIVARFTSIWRQESLGIWRIVFDTGNDVCPPERP
jgi:ketosteroid isomerase-like protein